MGFRLHPKLDPKAHHIVQRPGARDAALLAQADRETKVGELEHLGLVPVVAVAVLATEQDVLELNVPAVSCWEVVGRLSVSCW
jgi:hypothetical protein